jgi:hypothetical protein
VLTLASGAQAQEAPPLPRWAPGGGVGLCIQGETGLEVHANYLFVSGARPGKGVLHQIGPELAVEGYFNSPFYWGQRLGMRQLLGPGGHWAVSLTGGVENYTTGFDLQDGRAFVQFGVNFFGVLNVEYGMGRSLGGAPLLAAAERVLIRLDMNGPMLDRLLRTIPIS